MPKVRPHQVEKIGSVVGEDRPRGSVLSCIM